MTRRNATDLALDFLNWYQQTSLDAPSEQDINELQTITQGLQAVSDNTEDEWLKKATNLLVRALDDLATSDVFNKPVNASTKNRLRAARNLLLEELKGE